VITNLENILIKNYSGTDHDLRTDYIKKYNSNYCEKCTTVFTLLMLWEKSHQGCIYLMKKYSKNSKMVKM